MDSQWPADQQVKGIRRETLIPNASCRRIPSAVLLCIFLSSSRRRWRKCEKKMSHFPLPFLHISPMPFPHIGQDSRQIPSDENDPMVPPVEKRCSFSPLLGTLPLRNSQFLLNFGAPGPGQRARLQISLHFWTCGVFKSTGGNGKVSR